MQYCLKRFNLFQKLIQIWFEIISLISLLFLGKRLHNVVFNSENYNFQEIECNPENEFLSIFFHETTEKINVYPNPSTDYINIDSNDDIRKLQIIKMNGEKINVLPFSKNNEKRNGRFRW